MKNRAYIDQIKILMDAKFDVHKNTHGIITRDFFESISLKNDIRKALAAFAVFGVPDLVEEKFESLYEISVKELRHTNNTSMSPSISLTGKGLKGNMWLNQQRIKELGWDDDDLPSYRSRYIKYLEKIGRSKQYVIETKKSSLEILKKIGDPRSQTPFFSRGLVVGSVQSGKTANFNAVINSAVDAGYDLIIVLSGIMEDLRRQTQLRIEKEVEGKYKSGIFIGVGAISSFGSLGHFPYINQIVVPTSAEVDFNKTILGADFSINNKNILICKKNVNVLKNLLLWLNSCMNDSKEKLNIPFLIIDDEADNASLNNLGDKGKDYASKINGHIRAILAIFNKKTYIGYTATPFSNILQDRNEAPDKRWSVIDNLNEGKTIKFEQEKSLFPADFIELLFPPANYIGPKHFFETRTADIKKIEVLVAEPVRDFVDSFPSRVWRDDSKTGVPGSPTDEKGLETRATTKEDKFPKKLPDSLKEATICFIISTAVRLTRRSEMIESRQFQPHNTMLVHISRFTKWQNKTKTLIIDYIKELRTGLNNDLPSDKLLIYGQFERVWYKHYAYVMENIKDYLPDGYEDPFLMPRTFNDIKPLLITSISKIEVVAINSESKDILAYPENSEKQYIAVGGNRLSRGFTLEGLTINYFIRNTNYADTLLQMGRWFGYRPGYLDCCKLFATQDSLEKFDQTTTTIEDLENKFVEMNRDPNNTPSTFALLVEKHPGTLKITRPSILKNTKEVNWSYSDTLIQTTWFLLNRQKMTEAWESFKVHVNSINSSFKLDKDGYMIFNSASPSDLFEFLNLKNSFINKGNKIDDDYFREIKEFIKEANTKDRLTTWHIGIKMTGDSPKYLRKIKTGFLADVKLTLRRGPDPEKNGRWIDYIKNENIFRAGGASANIVTGPNDMAISLTSEEKELARKEYRQELYLDAKIKNPALSDEEILIDISKKNIPEKAFRRKMKATEGILMIYLIDTEQVFYHKGTKIPDLDHVANSLNINIPLIGYAIGIPNIGNDVGGTYLQSKHHVEKEPDNPDDDVYEDFADILEA